MEVCVAKRGVEAVHLVPGFSGEVELSLEEEAEVGVGGYDSAVKGVFGIVSHRGNVGVVVAKGVQAVYLQGVYPYAQASVFGNCGRKSRAEGYRPYGIYPGNLSNVEVLGAEAAVNDDGPFEVYGVADGDIGLGKPKP